MRITRWAAMAAGVAVLMTGLAAAQGYDKKTIEKMLGDGAKKMISWLSSTTR